MGVEEQRGACALLTLHHKTATTVTFAGCSLQSLTTASVVVVVVVGIVRETKL